MAEYTIDKIEYGDNVYILQDNVSGYVTTEVFYGTCETAGATAAKVVACENFSASDLKAGTIIVVYFSATNSGAVGSLTLNVNNTGAKSIKYINNGTKGNLTSAGYLKASTSYPFLYDGTNWLALINYNTTYSEISEANITNGSSSSTGLVSGRRAKAAVGAFESVTDVTVNGTSVVANRVAAITVPTNSGTITEVKTAAGTHSTIDVTSGVASFNVPTKTSHLTNDSGFITNAGVTSITTTAGAHTVKTSATGAVSFSVPTKTSHLTNDSGFITTDTNTTYALSGALSSHKFTSTLTAGGSGSGTSTSDFTLAAGTGITITDDASNRKMTIACSVTNTDKRLEVSEATSGTLYYPILSTGTTVAATRSQDTTGISYVGTTGSGSTSGTATLTLGNNVAGSSGKCGYLDIYGIGQYKATLRLGSALTANRLINLPNKDGTIALTSDLNDYLKKPTYVDSDMFGWKLTYGGTDIPSWDPPDTYIIGISDDVGSPGLYTLVNPPNDIRNAWSSTTLVLDLSTYNSSTDMFDTYRLVNYHIENIMEDNDYMYKIIQFSGIKNYWEGTQIKTRRILCSIYLDSEEQYHTDGEVTVTINEIASAGTDGSVGMTIDGWKICWGSVSLTTASASGSGSYTTPYYANSSKIPLNYTAFPYIWCQVQGEWTGTRYATPYDVSETGFYIRLYASAKNSTSTSIRWLAIGKA